MKVNDSKVVFSIPELAEVCGVHPRSITNWIKEGRIVARKLGRRTVILKEDAIQWLENAPRVPTATTEGEANG